MAGVGRVGRLGRVLGKGPFSASGSMKSGYHTMRVQPGGAHSRVTMLPLCYHNATLMLPLCYPSRKPERLLRGRDELTLLIMR